MHLIEDLTTSQKLRDFEHPIDYGIAATYVMIGLCLVLFWAYIFTYPIDCGTDTETDWYEECTEGEELNLTIIR